MKPATAEQLEQFVNALELVPAGQLADAVHEVGSSATAAELGQALVRRELLTGFQLERLLRGERRGYCFGHARLLYQVGAGSFARVYRAIHRETGGILAVKVLRNRFANDPAKCQAFRHEGEMGHMLRHPNIVAIDEVGEENGASYITMEFVEGQTLRELVKIRGALDVPKGLDLVHQMACGLEYAHRRGVTHRDLKASNVLISSTGQAKLVDFGLAGVDDSSDRSLGRMDKPRTIDYAALEKLTGMKDDAVRSDIYFLGAIAYLAFAGVAALTETRDRGERADPRRYTGVVPLGQRCPQVPRDVADFVSRMMHLDPLERFQTAGDVRRQAETLIARRADGEPSAVAPAATVAPVAAAATSGQKGVVMLVETSEKAQTALREFFTKLGYRVLLTENPQRALKRFASMPPPADCLIISARSLGESAIEAFNALTTDSYLSAVPAILITGANQAALASTARLDDRRRLAAMPIQAESMGKMLDDLVRPAS